MAVEFEYSTLQVSEPAIMRNPRPPRPLTTQPLKSFLTNPPNSSFFQMDFVEEIPHKSSVNISYLLVKITCTIQRRLLIRIGDFSRL
jgi:hypothetical protein